MSRAWKRGVTWIQSFQIGTVVHQCRQRQRELEKYPDLEMVSFGPTLRGVHSPDERLEIATVPQFWDLLLEVLKTV